MINMEWKKQPPNKIADLEEKHRLKMQCWHRHNYRANGKHTAEKPLAWYEKQK